MPLLSVDLFLCLLNPRKDIYRVNPMPLSLTSLNPKNRALRTPTSISSKEINQERQGGFTRLKGAYFTICSLKENAHTHPYIFPGNTSERDANWLKWLICKNCIVFSLALSCRLTLFKYNALHSHTQVRGTQWLVKHSSDLCKPLRYAPTTWALSLLRRLRSFGALKSRTFIASIHTKKRARSKKERRTRHTNKRAYSRCIIALSCIAVKVLMNFATQ